MEEEALNPTSGLTTGLSMEETLPVLCQLSAAGQGHTDYDCNTAQH